MKPSAAVLAAFAVSSAGCATVTTMQVQDGRHFGPYSGTRLDLRAIEIADRDDGLRRLSYLDLPLSFVCDTALLPLSLIDGVLLPEPITFGPPR